MNAGQHVVAQAAGGFKGLTVKQAVLQVVDVPSGVRFFKQGFELLPKVFFCTFLSRVVVKASATGAALAQTNNDAQKVLGQLLGGSAAATARPATKVTSTEASSGLKLALSKAADVVVGQLGAPGGFANDPMVKIGLPGKLAKYDQVLSLLDSAGVTDNLSGKLNAAAEGAVGKTLPLLKTAISKMTVTDAIGLVTGGPTSATDYFKRTMGQSLQAEMRPVVAQSLGGVNAFKAMDAYAARNPAIAGQFGASDLTGYVTQKASDGVFYYLAEQEKQIRANPVATGSALLSKVFGTR